MLLTDARIRNAKPSGKPVKLFDGGGLYLEVRTSGAKLWRFRYWLAGKENLFALGAYPEVSLAEAREQRADARKLVRQGVHPLYNRQMERAAAQAANANTFKAVALEWIDRKKSHWTPESSRRIERFLAADVLPYVGHLPIRSVTAAHLLDIIRRVEARGAETVALMLRQWVSAIFRYAVATLRADMDPTAALKGAIYRPRTKHAKPLTRGQIAEFEKALGAYGGNRTTVIALRLMLLTFVRTKELRTAPWTEIDLDRAEWRIDASRMKKREPHIVPLSRQAVALLRELHTYTGRGGLLFPNRRNPTVCMTPTTLNRALERMGFNGKDTIGFAAHGFRATASTFLNEMGFRPDVIERQLAHSPANKVRATYNQGQYLEERRAMMQQWADTLESFGADKVIPLRTVSTYP